jgi:hypothetical protein
MLLKFFSELTHGAYGIGLLEIGHGSGIYGSVFDSSIRE